MKLRKEIAFLISHGYGNSGATSGHLIPDYAKILKHGFKGIFEQIEKKYESLSEEDKKSVYRARKIQKFLSQPTHVAERFSGLKGVYVPIEETIAGFEKIVNGEVDDLPENAFYNVGTIADVYAKAEKIKNGEI